MRPIVDIYSTFLQRSFDQIFQEVALQNLSVTFALDRAGLVGPDGPTHHGAFDLAYMRIFPNMVVMAPGDAHDLAAMLDFTLQQNSPCSIRYPKAAAETLPGDRQGVELGRSETLRWGRDGIILCCGTLLSQCLKASDRLRDSGLEVGVVNARFAKPIDAAIVERALNECGFLLTVEEGTLIGGFGSAVLETAIDAGWNTRGLGRVGIPDRFIEHAARNELLGDLGLDATGITRACLELAERLDMLNLAGDASESVTEG